jgi:hypothetical protein
LECFWNIEKVIERKVKIRSRRLRVISILWTRRWRRGGRRGRKKREVILIGELSFTRKNSVVGRSRVGTIVSH